MDNKRKTHEPPLWRHVAVAGLAVVLLITPGVFAGHLNTSPAILSLRTNPMIPDQTAIRGTTERSSLGPDDVPVGVAAWATGNALGTESEIYGVRAEATGDASGVDSLVAAIHAKATGNATGADSSVAGLFVRATGSPIGKDSLVVGTWSDARGTTGETWGVLGRSFSPNGIGVRGVNRSTLGGWGMVGQSFATSGNGIGVLGLSSSSDGVGVSGNNHATSGSAVGVSGQSDSPDGRAIHGVATAPSGNTIGVDGLSLSPNGWGVVGTGQANSGNATGVLGQSLAPDGRGILGLALASSGVATGVQGQSMSPDGRGILGRALAPGNTVGVLGEVNSPNGVAIQGVNPVPGGLAGLFAGRVQINCSPPPCLTVNGVGVADLAESLPVAGKADPADVVVLTSSGRQGYGVARATRSYDTRVAGIVSTQPRVVLQVSQGKPTAPIAMVGIVPAKATAVNGPIAPGDLLTTSRVPGHLMRCSSAVRCVGAIVAKALEPLAKGQKTILVLIWRQ